MFMRLGWAQFRDLLRNEGPELRVPEQRIHPPVNLTPHLPLHESRLQLQEQAAPKRDLRADMHVPLLGDKFEMV